MRTLARSIIGVLSLFPALMLAAGGFPDREWEIVTPKDAGMSDEKLKEARDYALTGGGSGYITRGGRLVMRWGDPVQRYDLKSTTKSIGATALALAIHDGLVHLQDKADEHHKRFGIPPEENPRSGWLGQVTLQHLATQTAGFEKPGGYTKVVFEPGTAWLYSDGGPNWLAECLTLVYRQDMERLLFDRVFDHLGITADDLKWRRNAYRPAEIDGIPRREFGSGISANVDAMARIGLLYLREGQWQDQRILPSDYVRQLRRPLPEMIGLPERGAGAHGNASDHYSLLWWNNADGTLSSVPKDAFWSWGLYDSLIIVIPSLDLVVARAGKSWQRTPGGGHYDVLEPFLNPIVASVSAPAPEE